MRRVLVLGDSISADGEMGTQGAWRPQFVTRAIAAGFKNVVTVGTQQSNFVGSTVYSQVQKQSVYSLAISGFRVANILYRDGRTNPIAAVGWSTPGLQGGALYPGDPCDTPSCATPGGFDLSVVGHIDTFVPMLSPDLAIVMIGTNDIANAIALPDGDPTQTDLRLLVMLQQLASYMPPGTPIFVCTILPFSGSSTAQSNRTYYNGRISGFVVPSLVGAGIPAYAVSADAGFDATTMLQADGLHPNALGMLTVGNAIADSVLPVATTNGWEV